MVDAPRLRQAGDMTSDDELLSGFLMNRDEAAFERLVVRYGPMVLRVCRDILGDHSAADDAFQATFLVFFRQSASIRDRNSVGRWLYEVACRVARRARTGESKRRTRERWALTMEAVTTPDHEAADREARPILHEEIQRLPAKLRDAIVLCYLDGLTVEAAAIQLACPSGTLKSRLTKARDLLRARLTRRGLAASAVLLLLFSIEHPTAAAEVAEPLVQATVRTALGDFDAVPSQVEALASAEASTRRWTVPRLGVALVVLLSLFGGVRWSMATGNAPPAGTPLLINLTVPSASDVVRWARSTVGTPDAPRHCETSR